MAGVDKLSVEICECVVAYHLERDWRGHWVAMLDEVLPDLMTMALGVCERCGKPFCDRSELGADDVGG